MEPALQVIVLVRIFIGVCSRSIPHAVVVVLTHDIMGLVACSIQRRCRDAMEARCRQTNGGITCDSTGLHFWSLMLFGSALCMFQALLTDQFTFISASQHEL